MANPIAPHHLSAAERLGDVMGRDQFVYTAAYAAKIAAKNGPYSDSLSYDNSVMPAVVFTDPQVASVGLTEFAARDTRGLIKLVADGASRRLLGAHILAPEGADSIQPAALAIRHSFKFGDLADTIFPYITTVEGLKLAAQGFNKDVAKLSCCAG